MANLYPDKTINYRIYADGNVLLGVGTVDLPELSYMTDTLSGAGLAGEIDTPVIGHLGAMSVTINWRTITNDSLKLLLTKGTMLTLRASQQLMDGANNNLESQPVKILMRTLPKTTSLGSMEVGASSGSTTELEVSYLKIDIDNVNKLEIDKVNFICKVDGVDTLSSVRSDIGL